MNEIINIKEEATMSSTQLAELLDKEKSYINRHIREMFKDEIAHAKFAPATLNPNGAVSDYHLPEIESQMFVAKYDATHLRKISEYWVNRNKRPELTLAEQSLRDAQIRVDQERRITNIEKVAVVKNGLIDMNTQKISNAEIRMDHYETRKPATPFPGETTIETFARSSELAKDIVKIAVAYYGVSGRKVNSYTPEGIPSFPTFYKAVDLFTAAQAWVDDSDQISRKTWEHSSGKTFRPKIRL